MATKANLLVVDDELIVRDSLDKWFREEGYDVAVADSAHDALAKMAAKRFDLALVDIKMPGTDGVELQRRMHEIDPDMLVIIMTGYASVETAVAALKNGAYDYVSSHSIRTISLTPCTTPSRTSAPKSKMLAFARLSLPSFGHRRLSGKALPWSASLKPFRQ